MSARLLVSRRIRASAHALFDAWTSPQQLLAWWGPAEVSCLEASVDLRVGGFYRIVNRLPDGTTLPIEGEFQTVARPAKLVYTWRAGGAPDAEKVTVTFTAEAGHTLVSVLHEDIADEAVRRSHDAGWHGCLDALAAHVASAVARGPAR